MLYRSSAQSYGLCGIFVKMHLLHLLSALTTICLHVQRVITQPKVTDANTKVTYYGSSADGVEQFENIFFAQDTGGANRFAPPLPFAYPSGSRVLANAPGNACPQPVVPIPGFAFLFSNVTRQSEDCLNLRIARPAGTHSQSRLPVMVWIYGGGSIVGQIYDKFYDPRGLITQAKLAGHPVIYVAMNYRLGMLGFASSSALRAGRSENAGLRDQRLGLEWVKANIGWFGGDADRITAFGQSAGGTDISMQYLAYGGARGTPFTGAIMESGTATTQLGMVGNSSAVHTAAVAVKVGCARDDEDAGSGKALACLRALPLQILLDVAIAYAQTTFPPWGFTVFGPVVDEDFFPASPSSLYRSGRFSKNIPMIAGWTHDDPSILTPTTLNSSSSLKALLGVTLPAVSPQTITDLVSLYPLQDFDAPYAVNDQVAREFYQGSRIFRDLLFTCPALAFGAANLAHNATANIRFYEFNQSIFTKTLYAPRNETYLGIGHFSEIPYVFDELGSFGVKDETQLRAAARVTRAWSSFAAKGHPGLAFPAWSTAYPDGTAPAGVDGDGDPNARVVMNVLGGVDAGVKTLQLGGSDMQIQRCQFLNRLTAQELV